MEKFDYTKKEFCETFSDSEIKDFFKHLDRKTSITIGPNFYKHWGISEESVREPYRKHFYEIPVEVSRLYAELIRVFGFSYGADRRGVPSKKEKGKFPLEKYQAYIEELDNMLKSRLEPYQVCMIKNYDSYQQTKIFQQFLPILLERIAMLLAICVDYGSGDGHDIYYITIQQIDYLIESIVKNRVAYSGNEPTKLHSFEDAISGVFKTLTVLEDSPQPHKPVFSENLDAEILKSRLSFREDLLKSNVEELSPDEIKALREELLNRLNATVAPFLEEMSQAEMSLNEEIAQLVLATKSFWDSTSLISRRDLAEMTNYRPELVAFLDWLTEQNRPIEDVKTRLKGDLLSQLHDENYMQMVLTVNRLLQFKKYEYELEEIHEENPQTEDEWRQLVNRLVAEHNDMFLSGSIQENNIKNTREDTCNYYKQVKKSVSFQKLYSSLEDVVGTWLPHKIAHRQYESNTSNESSHPSRNP